MDNISGRLGTIYRLSTTVFFITVIVYFSLNIYAIALEKPFFFQSYINLFVIIFQAIIVLFTLIATFYLSYEKAFQRTQFLDFFCLNKRAVIYEALMETIKKPTKIKPPIIVPVFNPLCQEIHQDEFGFSNYCRETRFKKPELRKEDQNQNVSVDWNLYDGILKYEYTKNLEHEVKKFFMGIFNDEDGLNKRLKEVEIQRLANKNYSAFVESVSQKIDEVPMYSPVIVKDDFDCFRSLDRLFIKRSGSNLSFTQIESVNQLNSLIDSNDAIFMVGGNRSNISAEHILEKNDDRMFYVRHGSGNVDDNWVLQLNVGTYTSSGFLNLKCSGDKGLGVVARLHVNKSKRGRTWVYMVFGNTGENTKKMGEFIENQFDMIFCQFFPQLKKENSEFILVCGMEEKGRKETFPVLFMKKNNLPVVYDRNFLKDLTLDCS